MKRYLLILLVPLAAWGATITGGTITGGSFGAPVPGPAFVSFTDNFTRGNNTNISTGAPDPPGSYVEYEADANCNAEIVSNELQFIDTVGTGCDNDEIENYAEVDLLSADQCALIQIQGQNLWGTSRGIRLVVRNQLAGTGNQYEARCSSPLTCANVAVSTVDALGDFVSAGSAVADCDDELTDFTAGDYFGFCVNGTGSTTTTFRFYHMDAVPSDPEDANTWAAASDTICTVNPVLAALVDTGEYVGIGALEQGGSATGHIDVDNFTGTANVPTPAAWSHDFEGGDPGTFVQTGTGTHGYVTGDQDCDGGDCYFRQTTTVMEKHDQYCVGQVASLPTGTGNYGFTFRQGVVDEDSYHGMLKFDGTWLFARILAATTTFQGNSLTTNTDIGTPAIGDYIAGCVEGTGANTVFHMYHSTTTPFAACSDSCANDCGWSASDMKAEATGTPTNEVLTGLVTGTRYFDNGTNPALESASCGDIP